MERPLPFIFKFISEVLALTLLYYLVSALVAIGIFFLVRFCDGRGPFSKYSLTKIVVFVYVALFFVRFMGGDYLLQETIGLNVSSPFGPQGNVLALFSAILIWAGYAAMLVTASYPFFIASIPELSRLGKYFASATHLL